MNRYVVIYPISNSNNQQFRTFRISIFEDYTRYTQILTFICTFIIKILLVFQNV